MDSQDSEVCIASDLLFHPDHGRLTGNATLLHPWESLEGSVRMSNMFARPLTERGPARRNAWRGTIGGNPRR